jgi:hypothetical protein
MRFWDLRRNSGAGASAGLFALLLAASIVLLSPSPAAAADTAGPYHIQFRHSGKCMDNYQGSSADYNMIQQWSCVGANGSQKWVFVWWAGGSAHIRNLDTGKCLAGAEPGGPNGTRVVQRTCQQVANQLWRGELVRDGNPDYYLMHSWGSSQCIDIPHSSTANGTPLQLWDCVAGNRQQHLTWY